MTEVSSIFGVVSKRVPWKDCRSEAATSSEARLAGLVERVTYHNAENGFCVLRAKARGHRDFVTVVGHSATIAAGEWITASGEWLNDLRLECGVGFRQLRTCRRTRPGQLWGQIRTPASQQQA